MPILRGLRTLNSVQAGTTLAAGLETLLADSGRKDDFTAALNVRSHARRAANSALAVAAVAGSARAFDAMLLSAPAVDEFAGNASAVTAVKASAALVSKIINSPYGFKRWYRMLTWKQKSAAAMPGNINEIAYGAGLYVAVGAGGLIYTSPDLVTWTSRTSGTAVALQSVCFGGGVFVTIGAQGYIATSPDGITWTARTLATGAVPGSTDRVGNRVCYGNGRWVAAYNISGVGHYTAYTTDFTTWATAGRPTTATSDITSDMAFGNGVFVLSATAGGAGQIYRSVDGQAWVAVNPQGSTSMHTVAFDPLTQVFVAKGYNGGGLYSSPDGYAWTRFPLTEAVTSSNVNDKSIYFAGVFIYRNNTNAAFATNDLNGYINYLPGVSGLTISGFSIANGIPLAHGTHVYSMV